MLLHRLLPTDAEEVRKRPKGPPGSFVKPKRQRRSSRDRDSCKYISHHGTKPAAYSINMLC